jgi:hypothetical protein
MPEKLGEGSTLNIVKELGRGLIYPNLVKNKKL